MTSIVSVQPEKETIEKEKFFFSQHILMQFDPARPKKRKFVSLNVQKMEPTTSTFTFLLFSWSQKGKIIFLKISRTHCSISSASSGNHVLLWNKCESQIWFSLNLRETFLNKNKTKKNRQRVNKQKKLPWTPRRKFSSVKQKNKKKTRRCARWKERVIRGASAHEKTRRLYIYVRKRVTWKRPQSHAVVRAVHVNRTRALAASKQISWTHELGI